MLDGIIIIFTREFEPKDTFVNSIFTKMKARGRTYKEWMNSDTPIKILINSNAQAPMTFLSNAMVQFRMMGINFSEENVEHATFDGSHGISGTVITHWSS